VTDAMMRRSFAFNGSGTNDDLFPLPFPTGNKNLREMGSDHHPQPRLWSLDSHFRTHARIPNFVRILILQFSSIKNSEFSSLTSSPAVRLPTLGPGTESMD